MNDDSGVRQQLERILANSGFARARRSSQLLRYLVESTLDGRDAGLKEYVIGTELFGRPPDFDPRIDSLVRVEASRLRTRLVGYYENEGSGDPITIELPVGSYIPVFRVRTGPEPVAEVTPAAEVKPVAEPARPRLWTQAIAVCSVLLLITATYALKTYISDGPATRLTNVQRLSVPDRLMLSPVIGGDERRVFYLSNREGGAMRIWRHDLNSGEAQPLTTGEFRISDLDLSPDGEWLAYQSSYRGGYVHLMPAAGGSPQALAAAGRSPRFSSDGKAITFWVADPFTGFGKVFVQSLHVPAEPIPVATEFMDAHHPQFTPDGRIVICGTLRSNYKDKEHDLWIVPAGEGDPIKTGVFDLLERKGIRLHSPFDASTSFRWIGNRLMFSAFQDANAHIFSLAFSKTYKPEGDPERLYEENGSQVSPSLRGSWIAFCTVHSNVNIWSLPLSKNGMVSGKLSRLTTDPGEEVLPSISDDGSRMAFLAFRPPFTQIWRKDLNGGLETQLYQSVTADRTINRMRLSPDGAMAYFRVMEGPPPQQQAVDAVEVATGRVQRVCEDCGAIVSVSPAGDLWVQETGSRLTRLAVFLIAAREKHEIVQHPHFAVQAGRLSPDGKWIAFHLDRGAAGRQIFVAPFRGPTPIPEHDWIPVTAADGHNHHPAWSPDGQRLYFFSDRHGTRDLWMQSLDPRTKLPHGSPVEVYRFDDLGLTPLLQRPALYTGLSVGGDRLILSLTEAASTVSIGRFVR